ncbi:hypothetical protein ACHAWF_017889 [Thalassiosira exigua]
MSSSSSSSSSSSLYRNPHQRRLSAPLDAPVVIGYAHDPRSGRAERAIGDGARVVIWSFLHFALSDDDDADERRGKIRTDLDLDEIRAVRGRHPDVVHLAAFGGWNGPHPPAGPDGKEWFDVFARFNEASGHLFDGVDWDYEGHDDLSSPTAKFRIETLDVMADFSVEAKRRGMIVSMAPAESYLDAAADPGGVDAAFSAALNLPPRAWASDRYRATDGDRDLVRSAGFSHAGRQCYAYVLAKAGVEAFDWISIQLYEAYSPFAHDVRGREAGQAEALMARIRRLIEGYTVANLPLEPSEYTVKVPPSKLVIGIANGWADGTKFCKVEPSALRSAYESTAERYGKGFLGVMFWTIEEEDNESGPRLARSLNEEFRRIGRSGEL